MDVERERFYTIEEVMQILQLSRNTVSKLLLSGELRGAKVAGGRQWRIKGSDILAYYDEQQDSVKPNFPTRRDLAYVMKHNPKEFTAPGMRAIIMHLFRLTEEEWDGMLKDAGIKEREERTKDVTP